MNNSTPYHYTTTPDLNSIEHLWNEVGRRVRRPESIDQLQRALTDEWNNIPQAFVMRLIGTSQKKKHYTFFYFYNIFNTHNIL
jgi:transposase